MSTEIAANNSGNLLPCPSLSSGPLSLSTSLSLRSRTGSAAFGRTKKPTTPKFGKTKSESALEKEDVRMLTTNLKRFDLRRRSDTESCPSMSVSECDSGSDMSDKEDSMPFQGIDQRLLNMPQAPPTSKAHSMGKRASFIQAPTNAFLPCVDEMVECLPLEPVEAANSERADSEPLFLKPHLPEYSDSETGPIYAPHLVETASNASTVDTAQNNFAFFADGSVPNSGLLSVQQPSGGYYVTPSPAFSAHSSSSGHFGYQAGQFAPPPLSIGQSNSFEPLVLGQTNSFSAEPYMAPVQYQPTGQFIVDPATGVQYPQLAATQSSGPVLQAMSSGNMPHLVPINSFNSGHLVPAPMMVPQPNQMQAPQMVSPQMVTPQMSPPAATVQPQATPEQRNPTPPMGSVDSPSSSPATSVEPHVRKNVLLGAFQSRFGVVECYNIADIISPTHQCVVGSGVHYVDHLGQAHFVNYDPRSVDKEDNKELGVHNIRLREMDTHKEHVICFISEEQRKPCVTKLERKYRLDTMAVIGLVNTGINPIYQKVPINPDFMPKYASRPYEKTMKSFELAILDVNKSLKIKDVKRTFNEIARVKHVQMPMNKQSDEWSAFQEWKRNGAANGDTPAPARVPNTSTVFLTLKDFDSAMRVLSVCNSKEFAHEFGNIRVQWSHHSGAMRPATMKKNAKKQVRQQFSHQPMPHQVQNHHQMFSHQQQMTMAY